ncbi:MAG: hypothetical protein JNK34_01990 [Tabrizicola sp.]|nr:hypothetical protein [Tabrizicola sp.]
MQPEDGAEWHRLCSGQLAFYMTSVVEDVHTSTLARLQGDDPEACRLCDRIAKVTPFIQHSRL